MIKRGNTLHSSLTYSSSPTLLTSPFPAYDLNPQYQTIADRIERIKLQQRQKKQQEVYKTHVAPKRQPVVAEYQEAKHEQFVFSAPKFSSSQHQQVLHHTSSTKFFGHQEQKPSRRSVELKPQRSSSLTRNPQVQFSLLRSSSMGRLRKQQPQSQLYSYPVPLPSRSGISSCTNIDLEQSIEKQKQKRKVSHFLRKPLVAGRIYCKEELIRQEKEKEIPKIRRIPIHNLQMNLRR